jgi:hypothetical protein
MIADLNGDSAGKTPEQAAKKTGSAVLDMQIYTN